MQIRMPVCNNVFSKTLQLDQPLDQISRFFFLPQLALDFSRLVTIRHDNAKNLSLNREDLKVYPIMIKYVFYTKFVM